MTRLRFWRLGLDFDRDYGIDRRTGWSAVYDGSVVVQFVSFGRALVELLRAWRDG
jgi:hypothetical protein